MLYLLTIQGFGGPGCGRDLESNASEGQFLLGLGLSITEQCKSHGKELLSEGEPDDMLMPFSY